jgi:uncharacterized tellurite resistance protein B-like protein
MVTPATRRKFEALVAAAYVDGSLSESEKTVLNQKAAALGIPPREVTDILFLGQQRKLSVSIPPTSLERDALLEDLIEVVTADGRVEAPEYHMLARFAETLKIPLPELRTRVNRRMQNRGETRVEPRRETVRADKPKPQPPPAPKRPEPPKFLSPPPPAFEPAKFSAEALPPAVGPKFSASGLPHGPAAFNSPKFSADSAPPTASGPVHYETSLPKDPKVGDLPPVTLQLLKQSVMFDTESESIANIGRTLGIPPSEAAEIRAAILAAFPDLKPASQSITRLPRR